MTARFRSGLQNTWDKDLSPEIAEILCAIHVGDDLSLDAANERLIQLVRHVATIFGAKVTCLYVGEQGRGFFHCDSTVAAVIAERLEKIQHEMIGMAHCEIESGCIARAIHRGGCGEVCEPDHDGTLAARNQFAGRAEPYYWESITKDLARF